MQYHRRFPCPSTDSLPSFGFVSRQDACDVRITQGRSSHASPATSTREPPASKESLTASSTLMDSSISSLLTGGSPVCSMARNRLERVVQMVRISMELFGKMAASAEQRYVERKISRLARFVGPKPVECCQRTVRAFQYHHSRAIPSA